MGNYFCGWYYRCQSDRQTLALIPSFHKTRGGNFCTIQLITDDASFSAQFPYDALRRDGDRVQIGRNWFGPGGIALDLHTPEFSAVGSLQFGPFTPIRYDIMGPFQYVPFLQCRHSVSSMGHRVDGELRVNGVPYVFRDARGYLEGDRGRSFPKEYAWTCCSFPEGALMLSAADIPLAGVHFTGIIGVVLLQGKEYRLGTYLGARLVKNQDGEIVVRQGNYRFTARRLGDRGHSLLAPAGGSMTRTIHEHPACRVYYRFSDGDRILLEWEATNAAFEYEY